ncbi:glutaminyl-peptide cyclotransferase [Plutella xylostella]|uniref:glutaminyl-peptide cyclotransferase n=1 Tax=Plutella xylostella TaxID=51655 RepID=UPI0020331079|nr:glutaminyl-peptide cyclotransferase [Plutella xylostella]
MLRAVKMTRTFSYFTVATLCLSYVNSDSVKFYEQKHHHEHKQFSEQDVRALAALSDQTHFRSVLDEILIPRVVGTPNHEKVGNYIVGQMRGLGWDVKEDTFVDNTPVFGKLTFRNIIATLNPNADRYLTLACHYDSKYTREHVFVGATDSAVPCAMMMNLAQVMSRQLEPLKRASLSLMFIFFDGEEAFRQWGPTDSIYGARHLAKKWQNTPYRDGTTQLHRIDVLVLLDLLGTPDPVFYSYFQATEKWYLRLATAEQTLARLGLLGGYSRGKDEQTYYRLRSSGSFIEDDHIPFLRRNVNILHIIPSPFPAVWHRADDDLAALDFNTIDNLNKILRVFVAEYLHVQP